jgi:hypothetical protein
MMMNCFMKFMIAFEVTRIAGSDGFDEDDDDDDNE